MTFLCRPWIISVFASLLLWLATPYDLFYTLKSSPELSDRVGDVSQGETGRQIAVPLSALGALCVLIRQRPRIHVNGILGAAVLLWLAVSCCSVLWADDRVFTARKIAVLSMLCVVIIAAAHQLSIRSIMLFTCFASGLTLGLSIIAELSLGTFRPADDGYLFAGVAHPNQQGVNIAVFLLSLFGIIPSSKRKSVLTIIASIAILFLYLTRSRTAFGSMIIASTLYYWSGANVRTRLASVLGSAAIMSALALVLGGSIIDSSKNVILLGRANEEDAGSLTKRIPLWQECLTYLLKRPIGGYGYDSFWNSQRVYEVSSHQDWPVGETHNGYLEMSLGLGVPGGVCFTLFLGLGLLKYHRISQAGRSPEYRWAAAMLTWLCLNNLLETITLQPFLPSIVCFILLAKAAFTFSTYANRESQA